MINIIDILLIGISLSADAFAVAICKGLSINKLNKKVCITIATYFGLFQGIMPVMGYILGTTLKDTIINIDHWISFVLLSSIGANMIRESFEKDNTCNDKTDFKTMIPLSLATSIDALAIGITFAIIKVNIIISSSIITIITFCLSIIGVIIGNKFGTKYKGTSELIGGLILIVIGIKTLLEHLTLI